MVDIAPFLFIAASTLAFILFIFSKRNVDLLTIAYVGAMFYFSPLFVGRVLQSSAEFSSTVPTPVYLIATAYVLGLVLAAATLSASGDRAQPLPLPPPRARPMSGWFVIIALAGLVGALIASGGQVINADKVQALKQVGYLYVLFEIAASLACISAVVERRWWLVAASALLLSIDLLVGFRIFVVLTALSVSLVLLLADGRIRLFRKAPTYGIAAVVLVASMLLVHSARSALFDRIADSRGVPASERLTSPSAMRGDTIQYYESSKPGDSKWLTVPFKLFQQSEPFVIQATLAAVVERGLSCSPVNILKSLYLLLPPGFTRIVPNPFPPTFYDEYQPVLYPNVTYGLGGNIWAEMLCRFGYAGMSAFGVLLILSLVGGSRLLRNASTATLPPIALGGVVVAFYIERNDLNYTLVMLRQIAFVFIVAYCASAIQRWASARLRRETA